MPLQRSIREVFGSFGDALKNDIRKCLPATVTAVHAGEQTVDVQIAIQNVLFDDLGNVLEEDPISLSDVPLGVLRGGGMFVWLPVAVGDSVLLIFSDLSTDSWRSGDGSPRPPGWVGKHTMSSPFALPMVAPDAKKLVDPSSNPANIVIGKDGGTQQIQISGQFVELGHPATDFVAMAQMVLTELTKIQATLLTGTVAAAPGPVVFGTPYTASPVASALVKVG